MSPMNEELITLVDALSNFTLVHNQLSKWYGHRNSKKQRTEVVQCVMFVRGFYEELANQILAHSMAGEVLTPEAKKEIQTNLALFTAEAQGE